MSCKTKFSQIRAGLKLTSGLTNVSKYKSWSLIDVKIGSRAGGRRQRVTGRRLGLDLSYDLAFVFYRKLMRRVSASDGGWVDKES